MSKHMTIINLACTITKVRKWGEVWKHSAESAQAASAELHRKHKEAERIIETLRANLTQTEAESRVESLRLKAELAVVKDERDQLRVERDALRAQLDTERERHKQKPVDVPRAHPVKVGEYVKNDNGDVCQVHEVYAEYLLNTGWIWAFEHCTPCDPPTASHDTPAGKQAAESAVKREPKPGDTVRLVKVPTQEDYPMQSETWNPEWGQVGETQHVDEIRTNSRGTRVAELESGWQWPLSCIEIVEDAK